MRAGQDARPGAGPPPGDQVADVVGLDAQAAGHRLLAEPVGELALGLGERLAEVAARGRRPPDGREVGPHPLEVVGHAPSNAATVAAPPARRWRSRIRDPHTGRHGVPGGRPSPPDGPRLQRRAGRPGGHRPRAGQRGARAERRVQPGLGVPGARQPGRRTPVLGGHRRRPRPPGQLAGRDDGRAGGDPAVLQQGGVPASATPRTTRAGPTATRPAGRCRSGTWTPRWRAC